MAADNRWLDRICPFVPSGSRRPRVGSCRAIDESGHKCIQIGFPMFVTWGKGYNIINDEFTLGWRLVSFWVRFTPMFSIAMGVARNPIGNQEIVAHG